MNTPTTSLAKIRAAKPCKNRYRWALRKAGGLRKYGADTPITIRQIIETMSLEDALWCLNTMPEHDSTWRQYAVNCARRVQHLLADPRSLEALDVAERHAKGLATDEELAAARSIAGDSAYGAAKTAVAASARDAAEVTAWAASRTAAWAATLYPFDHTAAAWDAALKSERAWQAEELIRLCEANPIS